MMKQRARAIIIKQGCILLIKRTKQNEVYWVFPGGGVEKRETVKKALIRETREELGVIIKVGKILTKIKSPKPENFGQDEFFYEADLVGGILGNVDGPEYKKNSGYKGRYELTWVPLGGLNKINLKPADIGDLVLKKYNEKF